jgi:hypothetical protein
MDFVVASGVEMLSGLAGSMTDIHKSRIEFEHGRMETIKVRAMTFDSMMTQSGNEGRYVDFLSLDVEGGEMNVLEAIDFNKYRFGLIAVENNEETRGDGVRLIEFMAGKGYKRIVALEGDILFAGS